MRACCFLLMLGVVVGCGGQVSSDAAIRSALSAYEAGPTREAWLAMPGDVAGSLARIADDSSELPSRRGRALETLGWVDPVGGEARLRRMAGDPLLHPLIRTGAVGGLARALHGDAAVAVLAQALEDRDASVRFRAALELRHLDTDSARALRLSRLIVEPDASVRRQLRSASAQEGN